MTDLQYIGVSIVDVQSLADCLDVEVNTLVRVSRKASSYYHPCVPIVKPNGKVRQTYKVDSSLKVIQKALLERILSRASFPPFLLGSIKDTADQKRGYIVDAQLHALNKTLIGNDIADFFPSISQQLVFEIWCNFFRFPSDVSTILMNLVTYKGFIPQGACTSSAIANFVFWDVESELVAEFENIGLVYSRYVDDINVSSKKVLNEQIIDYINCRIDKMLEKKGLHHNPSKRRVQRNGERRSVHNLNVNSGSATVSKQERDRIRSAVYECERFAESKSVNNHYSELYAQTLGRINAICGLHPREGKKLIARMKSIKILLTNY